METPYIFKIFRKPGKTSTERNRDTHTHTDTPTDKATASKTYTQRETQKDTQRDTATNNHTDRDRPSHIHSRRENVFFKGQKFQ